MGRGSVDATTRNRYTGGQTVLVYHRDIEEGDDVVEITGSCRCSAVCARPGSLRTGQHGYPACANRIAHRHPRGANAHGDVTANGDPHTHASACDRYLYACSADGNSNGDSDGHQRADGDA